jgi:pimeloyl-ACP methyl ester carboxylesterase
LRAPTLIIAAVDHEDVFLETARTIVKLIPNAKVIEMKRCSHWPQMEDPETFNRFSLAFLRARQP